MRSSDRRVLSYLGRERSRRLSLLSRAFRPWRGARMPRVRLMPPHARYVPIRVDWGWGFHATWVLGLLATAAAVRLGGRIDDIKVDRGRVTGSGETLH